MLALKILTASHFYAGLSLALSLSIPQTVIMNVSTQLDWNRLPGEPNTFNLFLRPAVGPAFPLKTIQSQGQLDGQAEIMIQIPGVDEIFGFFLDDTEPRPLVLAKADSRTDVFTVVDPNFPQGSPTVPLTTESISSSVTTSEPLDTSDSSTTSSTSLITLTTTDSHGVPTTITSKLPTSTSHFGTESSQTRPQLPSSSSAPSESPTVISDTSSSSSATAVIVGSIFGAIAGTAILSVCFLLLFRRYQRRKKIDRTLFYGDRMVRPMGGSGEVQGHHSANQESLLAYHGHSSSEK